MLWNICYLLAPVLGLAVNVVCHVLLLRILPALGLLLCIVAGFLSGLAACVILSIPGGLYVCLQNFLTCAALGYGYFHFINLGQTGRRIRILREFSDAGGEMTQEQLLENYNAEMIVGVRMGRLLGKQQIRQENGRFFIGRKTVLFMSAIMQTIGTILIGKKEQHDTD